MKSYKMTSYLYGLQKAIPVIFGFLPVAISFAILARNAGMTSLEIIAMSAFVFAGASQIMAAELVGGGAGIMSIVIATFVINLRHIIMSTCVFKRLGKKNIFTRLFIGFGVTDETFALFTTEDERRCDQYFMFGLITVTYLSWVIGTVIGTLISVMLPTIVSDSFGIALYALFISLIVPDVKKSLRLFVVVVLTAVINTAFCFVLDKSGAIILSTLIGAFIGVFIVEDKELENGDDEEVSV
jgi:4-azaleucine resistance transporter AzlC